MLGSCKLLIFGIVSVLVVSLLIVSAFAFEPDEYKQLESSIVKAPPTSAPTISKKLFDPIFVFSTSSLSPGWSGLFSSFPQDSSSGYLCTSIYVYRSGQLNIFLESEDGELVYFDSSTETLYFGDTAIKPSRLDFNQWQVRLTSDSDIFPNQTTGSYWSKSVVSPIFGFFTAFFESILVIGNMLVSFVISRPIVLIPIVAMILVLSYGVIRRLIKGV